MFFQLFYRLSRKIPYVLRLQGKHQIIKRLNSFKMDRSIPVLLLPIKSAGNGLNLVEATHVMMIEPMLNIGMERQALSRVHRIGQEKETFVWRFIESDH